MCHKIAAKFYSCIADKAASVLELHFDLLADLFDKYNSLKSRREIITCARITQEQQGC